MRWLRVLLGAVVLFAAIGLGFFCEPIGGLRMNRSPSLPHTLFWGTRLGSKEKSGGYVSLHLHGMQIPVVKRVIGKAGDLIRVEKGEVMVNGHRLPLLESSPSGLLYSPIFEGKIPDGYLFLAGNHRESFDSRYAEFGLIAVEEIEERLWPIF